MHIQPSTSPLVFALLFSTSTLAYNAPPAAIVVPASQNVISAREALEDFYDELYARDVDDELDLYARDAWLDNDDELDLYLRDADADAEWNERYGLEARTWKTKVKAVTGFGAGKKDGNAAPPTTPSAVSGTSGPAKTVCTPLTLPP